MLRYYILLIALALNGCGPSPVSTSQNTHSLDAEAYAKKVERIASMNRAAEAAYRKGKQDEAAKIMEEEKPLISEVLANPHPTVAAMEAASDLDQLYGTMLLKNRHYGWARILFQGNLSRWKHWRPETPESLRRLKEAQAGMAECDRHIE